MIRLCRLSGYRIIVVRFICGSEIENPDNLDSVCFSITLPKPNCLIMSDPRGCNNSPSRRVCFSGRLKSRIFCCSSFASVSAEREPTSPAPTIPIEPVLVKLVWGGDFRINILRYINNIKWVGFCNSKQVI